MPSWRTIESYPFNNSGTWASAAIHIVCAVIGAGVLALPQVRPAMASHLKRWLGHALTFDPLHAQAIGNLGWIAGPLLLVVFFVISITGKCFGYGKRHAQDFFT